MSGPRLGKRNRWRLLVRHGILRGVSRPGEPAPAKDYGKVRSFAIDGRVIKPYTPQGENWYATDAFTIAALSAYTERGKPAPDLAVGPAATITYTAAT